MKNQEVLEQFTWGNEAKNASKNLISDGKTLVNYNTEIARLYGSIILLNGTKYSSTTSVHQNWLQRNERCVVVDSKLYDDIINMEDAYDLLDELYYSSEFENDKNYNLNLTLTTKKGKELKERVLAFLYKNHK